MNNEYEMQVNLLRAQRGVWIIQIEAIKKAYACALNEKDKSFHRGRLYECEQCLTNLISIIGED